MGTHVVCSEGFDGEGRLRRGGLDAGIAEVAQNLLRRLGLLLRVEALPQLRVSHASAHRPEARNANLDHVVVALLQPLLHHDAARALDCIIAETDPLTKHSQQQGRTLTARRGRCE